MKQFIRFSRERTLTAVDRCVDVLIVLKSPKLRTEGNGKED